MPQGPLDNVAAHWNKLIENFQTSAKDFYASVEVALDQKKTPGLKISRVDWNEGGVLSPKREYLRITGGRYSFDVCAAPFGTGYFFSSWLVKRPATLVPLFFVLFILAGWAIFIVLQKVIGGFWAQVPVGLMGFSLYILVFLGFVSVVFDFWLVALLARLGWDDAEAAIMEVPGVGWIYEHYFAPQTYYHLDTVAMFRTAADGAVKDTIDGLLIAKGLRALTEDERKPVYQKLL